MDCDVYRQPVLPPDSLDPELRQGLTADLLSLVGLSSAVRPEAGTRVSVAQDVVSGIVTGLNSGGIALPVALTLSVHPKLVTIIGELTMGIASWRFSEGDDEVLRRLRPAIQEQGALSPQELAYSCPLPLPDAITKGAIKAACQTAFQVLEMDQSPGVRVPLSAETPPGLSWEQTVTYDLMLAISRGDPRLAYHSLLLCDPLFLMYVAGTLIKALAKQMTDPTSGAIVTWAKDHTGGTLTSMREAMARQKRTRPQKAGRTRADRSQGEVGTPSQPRVSAIVE